MRTSSLASVLLGIADYMITTYTAVSRQNRAIPHDVVQRSISFDLIINYNKMCSLILVNEKR